MFMVGEAQVWMINCLLISASTAVSIQPDHLLVTSILPMSVFLI